MVLVQYRQSRGIRVWPCTVRQPRLLASRIVVQPQYGAMLRIEKPSKPTPLYAAHAIATTISSCIRIRIRMSISISIVSICTSIVSISSSI